MKTKLRTAVIGVGYLGRFHAQKYKNNPHVELVGVCDSRADMATVVARELGTQAFTSAADLLGKVDAVSVAASTQAHFDLGKMFLEAGVHALIEKPLAATLHQAEELVLQADKKNLKLAVGHIERFNPCIRALKEKLHKPKLIELYRQAPFKTRGADVSVLHDLMIHDIDLAFWLSGSDFKSFSAWGDPFLTKDLDRAVLFGELSNGCKVHIHVSRVVTAITRLIKVSDHGFDIHANSHSMELEKITPSGTEAVQVEKLPIGKRDSLQDEVDNFVGWIRGDNQPEATGHDGFRALALVENLHRQLSPK